MSDKKNLQMRPPASERRFGAITFTDLERLKNLIDLLQRNRDWMMANVHKIDDPIIDPDQVTPPPALYVPDVTIDDPADLGKCRVLPPTLRSVKPGSRVVFYNDTNMRVKVAFACGGVVSPPSFQIPPGQFGVANISQSVPSTPFECKYKVDCSGDGGGPKMIIEDPEYDG